MNNVIIITFISIIIISTILGIIIRKYENIKRQRFNLLGVKRIITDRSLIEFSNNITKDYHKLASLADFKPRNSQIINIPFNELIKQGFDILKKEKYFIDVKIK